MMFQIGDKVKVKYFSDNNPHNNQIGIVKYLHRYTIYSKNNILGKPEMRTQGEIHYNDGTFEVIQDMNRIGSGLVSPVELVQKYSEGTNEKQNQKPADYMQPTN